MALALQDDLGIMNQSNSYDTALSPQDESAFQEWKKVNAPNDSGYDYDLRGAFKDGLTRTKDTGHFSDKFKKPNHPTFSVESQYAVGEDAKKAGRWEGEKFISPTSTPANKLGLQDDLGIMTGTPNTPLYKALGAEMTPEQEAAHPVLGTVEKGLQNVATGGYSLVNGITFGGLDYIAKKNNIEPPKLNVGENNPIASKTDAEFLQGGFGLAGNSLNPWANAAVDKVVDVGGKVIGKGIEVAKDIGKENLKNRMFNLYNSAVGAKIKNVGDVTKIKQQRLDAMKTISDNSDNLVLPSGEKTPQDRLDLLHGLKQTKQAVWDKLSQMSGGATESGAVIDMKPIIQKAVNDTIKNIGEDALRADPSLLKSIVREAENAAQIGMTNPSRAQQYMASLNKELAPSYAAGKGTDYSALDFKRNLVNHLNDATEASIESALSKSGYGDMRDQYAAMKSSEKEIIAAANKHLRQVGGQGGGVAHPLVNLWSVEEAMQATGHALAGNLPAASGSLLRSAAIKTASKFVDFMKNPDRKISKMFELLKKYEGGIKPGSGSVAVEAELMPRASSMAGAGNKIVPQSSQTAIGGSAPLGLPEPFLGRSGVNPATPYAGQPRLPMQDSSVIAQGGPKAPLALPDKSVPHSPSMRSGVNPDVNPPRLPYGQSGPVIEQGTTYKPPFNKGELTKPRYGSQTAWELYYKNKFALEGENGIERNFIHPAKDAKLHADKYNERWNPDNPEQIAKRAYEKQVQAKKMAEFQADNYTEKLKEQIAHRKFLAQSVHPSNMKSGELQDLNLSWVKGKNLNSGTGWDVVGTNFDQKFPGILDKSKHIDEAMIEYAQTLTKEHQQALRQLINDAKRTPKPNKLK